MTQQPDRTSHVLDAIDHAIADWETSDDAMRWTPDPAPVDDRPAGTRPTGRGLRYGWTEVGYIDETVPPAPPPRFRGPRLQALILDEAQAQLPRIQVAPITPPHIDVAAIREQMRLTEFSIGPFTPQMFARRDLAALTGALAPAMETFGQRMREIGAVMRRVNERLVPLVESTRPPEPPTDPRERALWLRQHRNTGPAREPFARRRSR